MTQFARAARQAAETRKQKRKDARAEKRLAEAARAQAVMDARRRPPFAERLRAGLQTTLKTPGQVLPPALWPYRPLVSSLRALPEDQRGAAVDFVVDVEDRLPGVLLLQVSKHRTLAGAIVHLFTVRAGFHRPLSAFAPPRRSVRVQWDALVQHLCCLYRQPAWIDACFIDPTLLASQRALALRVGGGISWRKAELGAALSKAAAHLLSTSTERYRRLATAVRSAQARAAGVSEAQLTALRASDPEWPLAVREEVWPRFFTWLTRNPLGRDEAATVLSFLNCDIVGDDFQFSGRTATSLVAKAKQHLREQALRDAGKLDVGALPVVDIAGGVYRLTREDHALLPQRFFVHQIVDGGDLVSEGIAMRHCVGTYADRAKAGEVALFSVRGGDASDCDPSASGPSGRRLLTVEVDPRARSIEQVRGKCNRDATADERAVVSAWAAERGLTVNRSAW